MPPAANARYVATTEFQSLDMEESLSPRSVEDDRGDLAIFCKVLCDHKYLSPLLVFVPCGLSYGLLYDNGQLSDHERQMLFWLNFLGLIPMAWLIGKSTEDVADGVGELFGALINATFGNIVEVLLCIHAVNNGECLVTQLTLIGSILSNTLPVLAISLPTAYSNILQAEDRDDDVLRISRYASILLFMIYAQFLYFQFKYPHLFEEQKESEDDDDDEDKLSFKGGCVLLFCCTGLTAWGTHYLIHSITGNINFKLINKDFIAVILLPIIGNAAEHYTAILVAGKDKMDLTLGVAVGSSVQMALLVTPVSVLWGWVVGTDMTLDFHLFPSVALTLSVIMVSSIISDGQSTWLQGSLLVSTYVIISLIYFMERDAGQAS